ncbi:alpha/beta hydrolase [Variovorax sp. KK3]|uniref:alpha/beta hydrolase n=1 Tax=Variovorax sp. KK3 TaxID=1855728 RepID=UPI00097BFBCE|nr:alpha/beta hydrolase [Variovorax sp. KK3]
MKLELYPPQEPLSPLGQAYQARIMALGEGVQGHEAAYGDDPYQSLAVFPAIDPSGDVLVFLHGGGWTSGYKEWMYFMAPALTAAGVTLVSAGYRLAPGHVFPAGFEDAADAVAWVYRHIEAHGGDPQRIFVGGHSAGGHYAALLAVSSAWRQARALPSDVLRGCLPVSGVYRFGEGSGLNVRPRFLGIGDEAQVDAAASPMQRIERAACPPFLITHGTRDFPHLITQAQQMQAALLAAGVPVQAHVLEGADHFDASVACGDPSSEWPALAAAWMHRIRKP